MDGCNTCRRNDSTSMRKILSHKMNPELRPVDDSLVVDVRAGYVRLGRVTINVKLGSECPAQFLPHLREYFCQVFVVGDFALDEMGVRS